MTSRPAGPEDRKERHRLSHENTVETRGKDSVLVTEAVETPGKGTGLATKMQWKHQAMAVSYLVPGVGGDGGGGGRRVFSMQLLLVVQHVLKTRNAHTLEGGNTRKGSLP